MRKVQNTDFVPLWYPGFVSHAALVSKRARSKLFCCAVVRMKESDAPTRQYSLQTRLREETEAPFRKARMFFYSGAAASAGLGAFVAGLRVIAALAGVSGVQPLAETVSLSRIVLVELI